MRSCCVRGLGLKVWRFGAFLETGSPYACGFRAEDLLLEFGVPKSLLEFGIPRNACALQVSRVQKVPGGGGGQNKVLADLPR